jgi:O-antigen/teichoic acid export membrane protein
MQAVEERQPLHRSNDQDSTRTQVRSSSLFLAGRFLSIGINFAAQIFIVRYLSTTEYGALAYGLAVVGFLRLFATLGLHEAVSRFVPIYRENREYEKLFGTILFTSGVVVSTGMLIIAAVLGGLSHFMTQDKLALHLLAILIFLVPVEAADGLLDGLFASFAGTRDIFFRKYLLGPALKLGVVLLLIWRRSSVTFLAEGFLITSAVGVVIYSWMLLRLLNRQRLFKHLDYKTLKVPAREVLAFIIPGVSATLATAAIPSINIMLLGWMRTMSEVAYYRAAVPVAELNGIVLASFTLLYIPSASRLFAKADYAAMNKLYWQMSAWMSVLSFPIFAATFSFSQPLTISLYGARYAPTGPVLSLLSLGSYFNVLLGFNLQTLKVLEKLRYIMVVSLLAIIANAGLSLLLIPRYGATGAGMAAAGAIIAYNLLLQAGLPAAEFSAFDRRYLAVYLTLALGGLGLYSIQFFTSLSISSALLLAGCVSFFVILVAKKKLSIAETFPELLRVPFMRLILA